jgi:DNA repair protein RadD
MIGRGLRTAPGKSHCLVLDFADNVKRNGPINDVRIPAKGKKKEDSVAPTKVCPNCGVIHAASTKQCNVCGHIFEFKTNLFTTASENAIIANNKKLVEKWLKVQDVQYTLHSKVGKPLSIMVTYHCGLTRVKDWVCLNHSGWAKRRADQWARFRGYMGILTTEKVFAQVEKLKKPTQILVDFSDKYPYIKNFKFD